MQIPTKLNLKIYQGSTFQQILRWESADFVYVAITGITQAAPVVITAPAHGIPRGWRFQVVNVVGMKNINSDDEEYYTAYTADTNTVTINSENSISYPAYTSGGQLVYKQPVSVVGLTARMQIRSSTDATEVIDELTTENGKIVIDPTTSTITILIAATVTAAYDFKTAVYSLEVISGPNVSELLVGNVTLVKEVTR